MTELLSVERLRALLHYEPDTGALTWLVKPNKRLAAGHPAGCRVPEGYRIVTAEGCRTYAHRIAWALTYGAWPKGEIDHIDGDPSNDRISNLRDVTHRTNAQNVRRSFCGRDGLLGTSKRSDGRVLALIWHEGKQRYLGTFYTEQDAHVAYVTAKRQLHEGCTL